MVSLINFKAVDNELTAAVAGSVASTHAHHRRNESITRFSMPPAEVEASNQEAVVKIIVDDEITAAADDSRGISTTSNIDDVRFTQANNISKTTIAFSYQSTPATNGDGLLPPPPPAQEQLASNVRLVGATSNLLLGAATGDGKQPESAANGAHEQRDSNTPPLNDKDYDEDDENCNFVVTWRELSFCIKQKWHEKFLSSSHSTVAQQTEKAKAGVEDNAAAAAASSSSQPSPDHKVVLDKLDGSFKSGQLTAILGPSGAGKTTLLDCLTGHRKHGLSGTIKISASPQSPSRQRRQQQPQTQDKQQTTTFCPTLSENATRKGKQNTDDDKSTTILSSAEAVTAENRSRRRLPPHNHISKFDQNSNTRDNLKVSIIPQNDHLIGHLTVYETLNYASKMKNCSKRNFNHQVNINRVAQQLSLQSCLQTRINKLSGGQYKRVSIAQELLSNPDILILDEPTSGLDAMTCYQTVQVLRKLADERQMAGHNQIAVILTIHQPNSDVFQLFNHVYVVAQGGRCIYEGPPTNIESMINRVGLQLPSSSYNPATIIVEIAAGKFGLYAISKLSAIQKKQYTANYNQLEALSTPSTSTASSSIASTSSSMGSSTSSINDDINDEDAANEENDDDDDERRTINDSTPATRFDPNNNSSSNANSDFVVVSTALPAMHARNKKIGSILNAGFVADDSSLCTTVVVVDKSLSTTNEAIVDSGGGGGAMRRRCSNDENSMSSVSSQKALDGRNNKSSSNKCPPNGNGGSKKRSSSQKRLKLNSLNAEQKFPFWSHTYLHFHRSWISIVRDPLLCGMQLFLHVSVPIMVSLVYGTSVGEPNACPRAGPMDIMAYALEPEDSAFKLQEEVRRSLENIGYIFFKLYGIIFAAMTVTVLTFPLDMHVLVKEFRNGWYGLSSYFLGRTLADIPFQLTLPSLAMALSYYATGQPYSYMQWRFLSITGILILSSLIAQSQGLLFGAILMDRMKAAVFVAPAATTPIILFAGFLVRTQSIPRYLRPLSNLSYLRYAIEACLISRYGFNQCECDPEVFNQQVPELPPIARSMLDYWLSNFKPTPADDGAVAAAVTPLAGNFTTASLLNSTATSLLTSAAAEVTTLEPTSKPDLFQKLIDSLAKANSFGRNITSCEQVVPYPMLDYNLKDSQLFDCFAILFVMLIVTRLLTFFIVCVKVKRKV